MNSSVVHTFGFSNSCTFLSVIQTLFVSLYKCLKCRSVTTLCLTNIITFNQSIADLNLASTLATTLEQWAKTDIRPTTGSQLVWKTARAGSRWSSWGVKPTEQQSKPVVIVQAGVWFPLLENGVLICDWCRHTATEFCLQQFRWRSL